MNVSKLKRWTMLVCLPMLAVVGQCDGDLPIAIGEPPACTLGDVLDDKIDDLRGDDD